MMIRKFLLATLAFIWLGAAALGQFWVGGISGAIYKNIISDYGATCDGVHSDGPAFEAFREANRGLPIPIVLTIPPGSTCCFQTNGNSGYIFGGILNLTVNGYGATFKDFCNGMQGGFFLGVEAKNDNSVAGSIQTVSAGSSCVTLITLSDYTKYTVGGWGYITAVDLQGFGLPVNPGIFEYVQIASVNSSTGMICFLAPLSNTYLSTYPNYEPGGVNGIDEGGPATLYMTPPGWNASFTYNGLTLTENAFQIYAEAHDVTYNNVMVTSTFGIVPTQDYIFTANNVNCSACAIEADKMVDTMTLNAGTWGGILFQSSSIHTANLNNIAITNIVGTPQTTNCNGSTISTFEPGSESYGASRTFNGTNCVVNNPIIPKGIQTPITNFAVSSGNFTITDPPGSLPFTWAIPPGDHALGGARMFFSGQLFYEGSPFTVTGLTTTSGTTVQTTLAGGIPTLPEQGGTQLFVNADPMPIWNCSGCSGTPEMIDLSQPGAQNAPLYTYTKRTYTCAANIANVPNSLDINSPPSQLNLWGAPVSIAIDVTTPDTSAASPLPWLSVGQFGAPYVTQAGALGHLAETISLKTAGTRTMTPSTTTGAQTGDTLTNLSDVAAFSAIPPFSPAVTNNAATCPVVTVTAQTSR